MSETVAPEPTPEQAALIARVRRMMLIAGLTTAIGVGALLVAIGYRLFRSDGSVQITDVTATLPKGARVVSTATTGDRLAVTVEIGGATIPAGAPVAALVSSASRDESRFSDPDRFDIHRDEGNHAAFGFGHHFCSGRFFAREQMCLAVRLLLERFPDLRLVRGREPVFRGWEFRAPAALHVEFGAN